MTAYMATTGVVYNVLLRGIELPQGSTLPWSNEVLHVVAPDPDGARLAVRARPQPPRVEDDLGHRVFPLVWGIYTLIRGPLSSTPSSATTTGTPIPS